MDSLQRQQTLNKDNRQGIKTMYSENRQWTVKIDIIQCTKKAKKIDNVQWTMYIE